MKIIFPDKKVKEFAEGANGLDIANSISNSLAKEVLAISVNGEIYDAGRPITQDAEIKLLNGMMKRGNTLFGIHRHI